MAPPIRQNVLKMHPYSPGKPISEVARELGPERIVKLASNENPWGPSPMALEAIRSAAEELNRYPDGAAFDLRAALSQKFAAPANQIVLGNGADEILRMVGWISIDRPDDEIVLGDPSFIVYEHTAQIAPCKAVKVPLNARLEHDLPAMARAVTNRTRIVFIANPNNPTGTYVAKPELDAFLRDLPSSVLVLLDEAYFEFADGCPGYPDGRLIVLEGAPNVVALRTFSKAYGLAGARCGYAFTSPVIADAIERARQPFNVNRLAQAGCLAALDDEAFVSKTVSGTRQAVHRLTAILESAGAAVAPSAANFVWADFGRPANSLFKALLSEGVITRTGDIFGSPNCLRISVGTEEEIDFFEAAFGKVMAQAVSS